jgi:hypothetical protein
VSDVKALELLIDRASHHEPVTVRRDARAQCTRELQVRLQREGVQSLGRSGCCDRLLGVSGLYAVRRVEASQPVTEARAEVRAIKDEAAAGQGQSWAARYAARRMEAGQHVTETRAELRTVKDEAAAEAPRKARAMAL